MKEFRDRPRRTKTDEEMVKDYPRLAREYALLHQDYRKAIIKPLNIPDVSTQRETFDDFFEYLDSLTKEEYNADSLDGHKRAYLKSI